MNIGFYDPYFGSLGGGERYVLTLAHYWSRGHTVHLFWNDPGIIPNAQKRFDLDLSGVKVVPNIFATNKLFAKLAVSKQYDLIFFLSDGSIPTSFARHNILHFQVPFATLDLNPFKVWRYDAVVCNSEFTKQHLDPRLAKKSVVIYPPVTAVKKGTTAKKKIILSVGRFTDYHEAKKQSVMIDAFIKLESSLPDWSLILAGGLIESDEQYFKKLTSQARGHRITLLPNITYAQLTELYAQASIYWHATGFGQTDPKLMEHFGISTVEAMSAGAVPIVYGAGGQIEIVRDGKNGFVWASVEELLVKTKKVIGDKHVSAKLQKEAGQAILTYSTERFCEEFDRLLHRMAG